MTLQIVCVGDNKKRKPTLEEREGLQDHWFDLQRRFREGSLNPSGALNLFQKVQEGYMLLGEKIEEPIPEPPLDFLVRVDRSVKPSYPDWFKKLEHPELELAGPAEYDLNTVGLWLHDDQKKGVVVGNTIYDRLKKDNALASCLNLQDGLAIQAKGIAVFRKLFASMAVFLWGSVVRNRRGSLGVPYLYKDGDGVVVYWDWLDDDWDSNDPALRFGK